MSEAGGPQIEPLGQKRREVCFALGPLSQGSEPVFARGQRAKIHLRQSGGGGSDLRFADENLGGSALSTR